MERSYVSYEMLAPSYFNKLFLKGLQLTYSLYKLRRMHAQLNQFKAIDPPNLSFVNKRKLKCNKEDLRIFI